MFCVLRAISLTVVLLMAVISGHQAGAAGQSRPQKLLVGLLPFESGDADIVLRRNEPLRVYLESRLGLPVQLVVGSNYVSTGDALRFGRLDIAYLAAVTYILKSRRAQLEPFARPSHERVGPFYKSVIIVPTASSAKTLADLKDGAIAFGDSISTSGTWLPRYKLLEAGLIAWRDYAPRQMGGQDNVARAVAGGLATGGGLALKVYSRMLKEGKIDPKSTRILQELPPIPEFMWTFREGLDPAFKEEIRKAFLEATDREMLKVFDAVSFVPCDAADLDRVRGWMDATEVAMPGTMPREWAAR